MKDAETCIAEALLDRIRNGKYTIYYVGDAEAVLLFKKYFLWTEIVKVYVSTYTKSYFEYRGMKLESPLAAKALEVVKGRHEGIKFQARQRKLANIVEELKLDCREEN